MMYRSDIPQGRIVVSRSTISSQMLQSAPKPQVNQLRLCLLLVVTLAAPTALAVETGAGTSSQFPKHVNDFIATYCVSCHGPEKQKGKLRLDNISQDLVGGSHADDWHEVLDALNKGEMPPEDKKQPSSAERNDVVEYLTAAFKKATAQRRNTGGKVVMRRLTNYEYDNTLNDLLGLNENWSKDFPPDSISQDGFKNNGFYMGISAQQIDNYIDTATRAVNEAVYVGEQPRLKTIDAKDVKELKTRDGKPVYMNGSTGIIYWKDYPTEGTVIVDVVLKGANNVENIDGYGKLEAGSRLSVKKGNRDTYATAEVLVDPVVSKQGELVHLQYRIPKIEHYPRVSENNPIAEYVFKFDKKDPKGMSVVSMKAKGPYFESWPPHSHRNIFIKSQNEKNEAVYAKEILSNFMTRAWRRPPTNQEIDEQLRAFEAKRKSGSFVDAIKDCVVSVLVAPDFLYLVERKGPSGKREPLKSHELASRLSYFLWSSMPDEHLSKLANSGSIASPDTMRSEIRRLLKDKRSWNFAEQFSSQWLGLGKMNNIAVSPEIYPEFNDALIEDMRKETQYFFAYILQENLSALNFIDSDFTFLSERLLSHYGGLKKRGPISKVVQKVALKKELHRGGILTHASIHLANSDGEDSHAINRGVWLVDKILGNPPPPPPADVVFDKEIEGFDKLSLKQQLLAHVEKESCARCHMKFDPFGVAFENYDAVGSFRNKVRKLNEEELARRVEQATAKNPEITFKKIDTDGNGVLSQEEWYAHLKTHDKGFAPQRYGGTWSKIANIRGDKKGQTSHPKNTISLEEYTNHVAASERKELKKVEDNLPYSYVTADASTVLPDATKISNLDELKAYLLKNKKDQFAENIVRRLLAYALARTLEFSDEEMVQELNKKFKANDYKLGSLVEEIVLCDLFQTK